jgi:hypothetical protein
MVLALRLKIKIMGESSLVFLGLWFDCLWLPSKKIQDNNIIEEEKV